MLAVLAFAELSRKYDPKGKFPNEFLRSYSFALSYDFRSLAQSDSPLWVRLEWQVMERTGNA